MFMLVVNDCFSIFMSGELENVTDMVHRITNLKPLQQQMGSMLLGHISRQIQLRPDNERDITRPGNKVSITLRAFESKYINFEDSALWFNLRMVYPNSWKYSSVSSVDDIFHEVDIDWNSQFFVPKILALGGASLISRFQVWSGPLEIQDYQHYNILYGTLHAMKQTRFTPDVDTLMGITHLQPPYTREFSLQGETDRVSQWWWVKIPLISVLSAAGNIPNYQTDNPLRLTFTLAQADEVFKTMLRSTLSVDTRYCDIMPGVYLDNDSPNYVSTIPYDMSWEVSDIILQVHGISVVGEGVIDDEKMEVYTTSYTVMDSPTRGSLEERLRFQIKKSSITGVHAVMIDQEYDTNQSAERPSIDQWVRGGTIGAIEYPPGTPYDPSIVWWAYEIGGRQYPTDTGAGSKTPTSRDANTIMWHHEYERYNYRNTVSGSTYPAMLLPNDDSSNTYNPRMTGTRYSHGRDGPIYPVYSNSTVGLGPLTMSSLMQTSPSYFGMTESLYGSPSRRFVRIDTSIDPIRGSGGTWEYMGTTALTGGKFIMACAFTPVDKNPSLIQGIDTERYPIDLVIRRSEAINTNVVLAFDPTETYDVGMPLLPMSESSPLAIAFFRYNVRLTFHNGVVTLDD